MTINPLDTLDDVQPDDIDSGPVVILNLLKFKPGDSLNTYLQYASRVMNECGDSGIEILYGGELREKIQGDIGDWDAILLARYPGRRHAFEMFRSEKYQAITHLLRHPSKNECCGRPSRYFRTRPRRSSSMAGNGCACSRK
jgi:uncharacterized protein (DUF1330 family)